MLQSRNPAMNAFNDTARWDEIAMEKAQRRATTMTLGGTLTAFGVLLGLCIATAMVAWQGITGSVFGVSLPVFPTLIISLLGGLGLGLVISFVPKLAPALSPVYAILEGGFLAAFSFVIATRYLPGEDPQGLIFQAMLATFGIAGGMLGAYSFGLIRIGSTMMKVMCVAGSGVFMYGLGLMVFNGFLGMGLPNLFSSTSGLGIAFTAVLVGLASLFLVLDFQQIEAGIKSGAPKHMEWYGAFGLLVTLVWLYMEVLRLIAKLRSSE